MDFKVSICHIISDGSSKLVFLIFKTDWSAINADL